MTAEKKLLPVVLRFWDRGVGHVRAYTPDGSWKMFVFVRQAREWAEKHGYDGIKIRVV